MIDSWDSLVIDHSVSVGLDFKMHWGHIGVCSQLYLVLSTFDWITKDGC